MIMKKIINWFKESNRYLHILCGIPVGMLCNDLYCTELVALGVSGSLEYKDKAHGGKWDWIDFIFTDIAINLGYCLRRLILWIAL